MLKEETVTGRNARRVMNGEAPVKEVRGEDELTREKELTQAYFQLSLVDHYSMKDGALATRVKQDELRTKFEEAMEACLVDCGARVERDDRGDNAETKEDRKAREMLFMLRSFTRHDRKKVLDKYSVLLYNHSLEKINVNEVLDRLKKH